MSTLAWALWVSTFVCATAAAFGAFAGAWRSRLVDYGRIATTAGAVLGIAGLVHRTIVAGHLPLFGTFENTYTASVFLLGVSAVVARRDWVGRDAWRLLAPWAVVLMLWGLRYRTFPTPITISEQSVWIDVHVLFAWLAHAILLWGGTLGLYRVLVRRRGERPEAEDRLLLLLIAAGYVLLTIMISVGAWFLFVLFAKFWRWEIVGTLGAIVWLGYSLIIHGALLHGVRGRSLDWYAALMLVPLLLLFWVWSVYPNTYHFFDIVLVRP